MEDWLARRSRPIKICGAIASALLILAPSVVNSWWYLFSATPPYQWLHDRGYPVVNFSALWITGPIGIGLLVVILWSMRSPSGRPEIKRRSTMSRASELHETTEEKPAVQLTPKASPERRPIVIAESLKLKEPITLHDDYFFMNFVLTLQNSGDSIAKKTHASLRISTMKVSILDKTWNKVTEDHHRDSEQRKAEIDRPFGYVIAPQQRVTQPYGCGGPGAFEETPSVEQVRTGAFFVLGYLEYEDQGGATYFTRFTFIPDGDSVRAWDLSTFLIYPGYQDAS